MGRVKVPQMLIEVQTGSLQIERLTELLGGPAAARVRAASQRARVELGGRSVVNVNSTARGGGVAEMLLPLVAYARGLGIDARWLVADGDAEFFRITKRIHNRLHGVEGDGGPLGAAEEARMRRASVRSAASCSGDSAGTTS